MPSIIKDITKAIVMAPVRVIQGAVEAANDTAKILDGSNKK